MGQAKERSVKTREPVVAAPQVTDLFTHPATGNYLTIAAAVVLQFVIILLPLVGPAGSIAPHAAKNSTAFLSVLLLALILSSLAVFSKLKRRREDGSPFPIWSCALLGVSIFVFCALFAGVFRV